MWIRNYGAYQGHGTLEMAGSFDADDGDEKSGVYTFFPYDMNGY